MDKADALQTSNGWAEFLEDIDKMAEERGRGIIYGIASDPETIAQQNYQRGFIACCELILSVKEDLRIFKESRKKR